MAASYTTGGPHRQKLEEGVKFRCFDLKHFTDRNEALNWLNQSSNR